MALIHRVYDADTAPIRSAERHSCGLWPFSAGSGSSLCGAPLGQHLFTGVAVSGDPISWFRRAHLIPNPSLFATARLGRSSARATRIDLSAPAVAVYISRIGGADAALTAAAMLAACSDGLGCVAAAHALDDAGLARRAGTSRCWTSYGDRCESLADWSTGSTPSPASTAPGDSGRP